MAALPGERRPPRRKRRPAARLTPAARKALDDFLAIAAHELKTPIVALQLQVRLLQAELPRGPGRERIGHILERIDLQSRRVMELTNSLLDVSRLTQRIVVPSVEIVDLSALVRDAVGHARVEARAAGCEIAVDARAPLPVGCDPLAIEQVVLNLLSNAIKYGAGKPIHVRVRREGRSARVDVRDTGIGILRADRIRIFERFVRAVPATDYGGLGLGLYIVRRIVRMHGGTVRATGTPNRGATFSVTLPLRAGERTRSGISARTDRGARALG